MASKSNDVVQFRGYCEIPLNEQDFGNLDQSSLSAEEIWLHLSQMVTKGYRVTMSYDMETRRAKFTAMDVLASRTSAGWMLSAESDTITTAAIVLLYKHEAKMGGDWVPFCNQTRQVAKYR